MELKQDCNLKNERDYALIQKALGGNQQAYADLMNFYRESLYIMMLKMTNNPYYAEDLTIEAFSKAFQNLSYYTNNFAFSTWLFKIASNNCIDYLRKKRLQLVMIDETFDSEEDFRQIEIKDTHPNPEEEMCTKEEKVFLRKMVKVLKPHYRELIEYRYFEEYSYEEIAQHLNLPLGTVKAKLFRAKDMLHTIMRENKN